MRPDFSALTCWHLRSNPQQLLPLGQRELRRVKNNVALMDARLHHLRAELGQSAPQRRQIFNPQFDFSLFCHFSSACSAPPLSAAANFRYYTGRTRFTSPGYPDLAARTEQLDA